MSWSSCEFVGKYTGGLWKVDVKSVCAFLYWSMILPLQWPGLGSFWARPTGHQFCGHIHLHLGHQVRISMFLHSGEITGLYSIIISLQGKARSDECCSLAVRVGTSAAFPASSRWFLLAYFQASSESVMGTRVVQLSCNCLASLPAHFRYFLGGFSWSPRVFFSLLGVCSWVNEHCFMIL